MATRINGSPSEQFVFFGPSTNFGTTNQRLFSTTWIIVNGLYAHNLTAAIRYVQLYDANSLLLPLPPPRFSFFLAASGVTLIDNAFFGRNGALFSEGLVWAISTTESTFTDSGGAGDATITIVHS